MRERLARIIASLIAILAWAALGLQLALLLARARSQGGSSLAGLWEFVGYFTILTNFTAALVASHAALWPAARTGLGTSRMGLSTATSMALVGITYSAVLRQLWNPQGWQKIADMSLHDLMPVLFVVLFLVRPQDRLRLADTFYALIAPLLYCLYAFARGAWNGWYAYGFLDPSKLSLPQLALNMLLLAAGFWIGALVLMGLSRVVNRNDARCVRAT
jgi:hypothetical protein